MKLSIKTPLILSQPLSARLGLPVWLKLEALQPSGSFKNRGIGELCTYYAHQKARCFVSFSGGNAGLAVAYAGRQLGTAVKVIVPPTSSQLVRDKMRQEGAEVIVHWDNWHFAEQDAKKLAEQEKGVYVHPFDHPLIWQGHSKIIDEIVEEGIRPGAVALSVGGGGAFMRNFGGPAPVWINVHASFYRGDGGGRFFLHVGSRKAPHYFGQDRFCCNHAWS